MKLGGTAIGSGARVFVIAEAGVNHNGDVRMATRLVDAAVKAGADAVKFQTFSAGRLTVSTAPLAKYQKGGRSRARNQRQLLEKLELDEAAHRRLKAHCRKRGIGFLSTPFDEASADFLESLGVAAFKVSSGDLTNVLLLEHVAAKGRPVILSTGMASLGEVERAVGLFRKFPRTPLALLHCVSNYPADPADANLLAIPALRAAFGVPVGWSDHTEGTATAIAAVALGASIIEKHITLDRGLPGPDHKASMEPADFRRYVADIRMTERSLGDGEKRPAKSERDTARVARRSLVAARDIRAGETFDRDMIAALRPGTGLAPYCIDHFLGRRAARNIRRHALLELGMIA
jgi:N-acetylneuraminate synthase